MSKKHEGELRREISWAEDCGCEVVEHWAKEGAAGPLRVSIAYCPTHAAAPELLEAARRARTCLKVGVDRDSFYWRNALRQTIAAIVKAEEAKT
jgi:hypothetical protein